MTRTILVGDALEQLRRLPTASVDCCICSPPFYMLRSYGVEGQMGMESDVGQWAENLRRVFDEVRRVLVPPGSLWVDVGDSYSRHPRYGAPAKSLLLAPARLALSLSTDGWIVRNALCWSKTNPMPTSVGDRLSNTYDTVFHLVTQPKYFYDLDAIRLPHRSQQPRIQGPAVNRPPEWAGPLAGSNSGLKRFRPPGIPGHLLGKNPGDVWRLPAASYRGAHFATYPEVLVEPLLKATCPLQVCTGCNTPWRSSPGKTYILGQRRPAARDPKVRRYPSAWRTFHEPGELRPGCTCSAPVRRGIVLDPFMGTGTTAVVAERLGRDWVGCELNPDYVELAWQRLGRSSPDQVQAA